MNIPKAVQVILKEILANDPILIDKLEGRVLELTRKDWGSTIDAVLPRFQRMKFPVNCFAGMVYTGAKGSKINHSQIGTIFYVRAVVVSSKK